MASAQVDKSESSETPESPEHATTPVAVEAAVAAPSATNNEETASAITVSGSPTEMYAQLQAVVAYDAAIINDHVAPLLELMHASEDPTSPILLRVRFLEFVAKNVANLRDNSALKKIVTSLVKIIGAEDNTPKLLIAALQCFPGLGPVSMLDKRWEYLSREGADILMQVIIDKDAFAEPVRQAARKSLDALTDSAFPSVVTKLIHWLSSDREDDEEDQIRKERHLALTTLTRVAMAHSAKVHWTEERQEYVLSLIYRVLGSVDAREFAQLARIAAHLPIVHAKHGLPLLESFLAENRLDSERNIEAVSIIGRSIHSPAKKDNAITEPVQFDLVTPMESAGLLKDGSIDPANRRGLQVARVALLAARLAPAEAAEKLLPFIVDTILSLVGSDGSSLPENLSTLETLLFAAIAVSTKKSAEMLQTLNEERFNTAMASLSSVLAAMEPQLIFAIKKKMRDGDAGAAEAEELACVHNIRVIAAAFASKHLPMGDIKGSWIGKARLPAMKRDRAATSVLPPAPGTSAANDRSRFGSGRRSSSNNNNNNNNSKSRNNSDRIRGQSGSRHPGNQQRTASSRSGPRRRF